MKWKKEIPLLGLSSPIVMDTQIWLTTATRKVLGKRDDLKCSHYRGASFSPALFENLIILTFDGADLQYVVGLDKTTGETVWKTNRSAVWNDEHIDKKMVKEGDWRKAHGTPLIVTIGGKPVICSVGAEPPPTPGLLREGSRWDGKGESPGLVAGEDLAGKALLFGHEAEDAVEGHFLDGLRGGPVELAGGVEPFWRGRRFRA